MPLVHLGVNLTDDRTLFLTHAIEMWRGHTHIARWYSRI
jgi:hypothetical protein